MSYDYYTNGLSAIGGGESRSISPENPTGEKEGGARAKGTQPELGDGWKARPYVTIGPHTVFSLADIEGPATIRRIWMTGGYIGTELILRFYWEDSAIPSVECPLSAFFAFGFDAKPKNGDTGKFPTLSSVPVTVAPRCGLSCYWEMPFRKRCRITVENTGDTPRPLFYQVSYELGAVGEECGYFHAQYRQQRPVGYKVPYTVLDGVKGKGHYVGTALFVTLNGGGKWWGEGEVKFYLDGDGDHPTICGTGTEDYFGGAYNWDVEGEYSTYSLPYSGMYHFIRPDMYCSQERFSCYRWHIPDPIRFEKDIKVTVQDLGWRNEWRFLPRRDDFMSVAYWYQDKPNAYFPPLPGRDELEVVIE